MFNIIGSLVTTAIIAYLWGSIPAGYWMGQIIKGKDYDIRDHGSKKIGATNVQRTLGTGPAIIVLFIDLSKGIGPALLATFVPFFYGSGWGILVAGLAALLGHCFPIFIGFKGGRGVLTGAGVILVCSPLSFLITAITTIGTISIWRYVSLGSIVGCVTGIVLGIVFYLVGLLHPGFFAAVSLPQMLYMLIGPALIILFHRDNIGRLLAGKERKLGQKAENVPASATK
ncbi:glycerol-3-phosphate 1-O-acyltransferase PlsY [Dictyobacter arantiisoli]|uniref:Glycerol-3-phosphate acyltransferase n=1 Tax=Dictyobacter arantiisoli TaxID=2014874 RepID=A0A5A5TDD7_9CHLR|nr:glycerol-3-phosphate 1-O-acyltransferase PlsY [Dictyobacter arantiisoli]GCF09049.1 glycerol-3-phosphate acyltransferase 2 [Dictyobacter arantiisoli]